MWVLLILVLLQVEVSVPTRDVGRGMHCQRPHSGSLAGECSWESFPWAEGPAVGPAPPLHRSGEWVSCSVLCLHLQREST